MDGRVHPVAIRPVLPHGVFGSLYAQVVQIDYASAFWSGVQSAVATFWTVFMSNPWLLMVFGFIIIGSLALQLSPLRRTRKSRR